MQLLPVSGDHLARLDALIETLMELRDALDGDTDLEPEHHDGEASFPGSPLYAISDPLATAGGPGDPQDAEVDEEPEDADADEWSAVDLNKGMGSPRWA
jgi:hypothetical protein